MHSEDTGRHTIMGKHLQGVFSFFLHTTMHTNGRKAIASQRWSFSLQLKERWLLHGEEFCLDCACRRKDHHTRLRCSSSWDIAFYPNHRIFLGSNLKYAA
jgi:hypothetical protein